MCERRNYTASFEDDFDLRDVNYNIKKYHTALCYFTGVRFAKDVFSHNTQESLRDFAGKLCTLLEKYIVTKTEHKSVRDIVEMPCYIKYNEQSVDSCNCHLLKARLNNKDRLFFYVTDLQGDKIINFIGICEQHEDQDDTIRQLNSDGMPIGSIYWPMEAFVNRLEIYNQMTTTAKHFKDVFNMEYQYITDDNQQYVKDTASVVQNLSIVGNAGSGKSIIGENWLRTRMANSTKVLYLTMSESLVQQRRFINNIGGDPTSLLEDKSSSVEPLDEKHHVTIDDNSRIEFETVFGFMLSYARRYGAKAETYMDSNQSFVFFQKTLSESGINLKPLANFPSEDDKLQFLWRKVHGQVKGCVPDRENLHFNKGKIKLQPILNQKDYVQTERKAHRSTDEQSSDIVELIYKKVYAAYRLALKRAKLEDDNDLARYILDNCPPDDIYSDVFIDECQDLTEVELLALFYVFKNCKHRLMASDRCQIVQPTYFKPGIMLQLAQVAVTGDGKGRKNITSAEARFNHNYRSGQELVGFQNAIIKNINSIFRLTEEELREIVSFTSKGKKPIWITATDENKRLLKDMLGEIQKGKVQLIFPYPDYDAGTELTCKAFHEGDKPQEHSSTDVIRCKGMEYRAVLLWEILGGNLSSNSVYTEWAWRYFYVGATRAQQTLMIFEQDDTNDIARFLNAAAEKGIINKCVDLEEECNETGKTWLQYIWSDLEEFADDDYLEQAESLIVHEEYEDAIEIYEMLNDAHPGMYDSEIARCHAYRLIKERNFIEAMEQILQKHEEEGLRRGYVKTLTQHVAIDPVTYLVGLLYLSNGDVAELKKINRKFHHKYGLSSATESEIVNMAADLAKNNIYVKDFAIKYCFECMHSLEDKHLSVCKDINKMLEPKFLLWNQQACG